MIIALVLFVTIFLGSMELERHYRCAEFFSWYAIIRRPKALLSPINVFYRIFFPNPPFVPLAAAFPNHQLFDDHFTAIKQEINALLCKQFQFKNFGDIESYSKNLAAFGWKSFFIKCYAEPLSLAETLLPLTTSLIKQCPEITLAMLSILEPGATIKPHYGPSKACYRYHLCLFCCPSQQAFISVGGEEYFWKEGEGILFDDTYLHFAKNPTLYLRIVLFCDVERRLPVPVRQLNRLFIRFMSKTTIIKKMNAAAE